MLDGAHHAVAKAGDHVEIDGGYVPFERAQHGDCSSESGHNLGIGVTTLSASTAPPGAG